MKMQWLILSKFEGRPRGSRGFDPERSNRNGLIGLRPNLRFNEEKEPSL